MKQGGPTSEVTWGDVFKPPISLGVKGRDKLRVACKQINMLYQIFIIYNIHIIVSTVSLWNYTIL